MPEVGTKAPAKPSRIDKPEEGDATATSSAAPAAPAKKVKEVISLPPELQSKQEIMAYLNQYGFGAKQCENLYRTQTERNALDAYTKSRAVGRVPDEFFIAALRLHHSGRYPIVKPSGETLDSMAINPD